MALELLRERHGGVLVLTPCGRLDNQSAAEFELCAQELLAAGERHILADLSRLDYISNAGLRVLAGMAKALAGNDASLRLAGLNPSLMQVFDAAGFTPMFSAYGDRAAALASHPAAADAGALAAHAAALLGVRREDAATAAPAPPGLSRLVLELLAGGTAAAPAAARALAEGTRMVPRVQAPGAEPGRSWWRRLLDRARS